MRGKVVIAGGSGYIGRHLCKALVGADYEVVLLSRRPNAAENAREVEWDGRTLSAWIEELSGARAVVNLAGESIAKHWSEASKLAMQESRIFSTRVIGEAIAYVSAPPEVWVNASAAGYYGNRGDEILTEESQPGFKRDFLVDLCVAWEHEQEKANLPSTRKVRVRIGVVLGKESAAFEPLHTATRFFLGGHFGNGRQYMSWIHVEDLVAMFRWAIEGDISGVLNGTAPEPVRNEYLMTMMRAVMKRPWAPPIPALVLKLVSFLGGPEASLLLDGQQAMPEAAVRHGFEFKFPRLRESLTELVL